MFWRKEEKESFHVTGEKVCHTNPLGKLVDDSGRNAVVVR